MFQEIEAHRPFWFVTYLKHWLLAVPVSILAGLTADQYFYERLHTDTILGQVGPCATIIGAVIGYFFNRKKLDRIAPFVFTPALVLFLHAVSDSARRATNSPVRFIVINALGIKPGCEGDCFDAIGAVMLAPSLAYSIGAGVAVWRARASKRINLVP